MGVNDDHGWELQWHPASGRRLRRFWITRRQRRWGLALAVPLVVVMLALVTALPFGARALLTRFRLEAFARENRVLHRQLEARREEARMLGARVGTTIRRGRRLAWSLGMGAELWGEATPSIVSMDADDGELLQWLAGDAAALGRLADGLAEGRRSPPCSVTALPSGAPVALARAVPISLFGWRISPFTAEREAHHGVTLAAPAGEPVVAPGDGRVVFAGVVRERRSNEWTRLGRLVVIRHGEEVYSVLGGLGADSVRRGQQVRRGEQVGVVGQTAWTRAPALYFEIRWPVAGAVVPIDPALVSLGLPLADLDARFSDPTASLPDDFASMRHLPGRGR